MASRKQQFPPGMPLDPLHTSESKTPMRRILYIIGLLVIIVAILSYGGMR